MRIQFTSLALPFVLVLTACNGDAASSTRDDAANAASGSVTSSPAAAATGSNAPATTADAEPSAQVVAATGAWAYASANDNDGTETRASITGTANGAPATLVFSDHDVWGRNALLQPSQGEIECPVGCKVQVSVDGGAAQQVQASRPEVAPPRLSLREPEALWRSIASARTLVIEYPVAGGAAKAEFQVAGADSAKLPGWN